MTATDLRSKLRRNIACLETIRDFFRERNVVEVSTPSLAPAAVTDPALASIECTVEALGGRQFLHTSPEFAMKRLLAHGSGDIWQLARVYRDHELGRWHQPEFLLLEWYRLGFDEFELMDEVFDLLRELFDKAGRPLARLDITFADAFDSTAGIDPHRVDAMAEAKLAAALRDAGIGVPESLSTDAMLDLALTYLIVPQWPRETAVFLYDYPATQASLAAIKGQNPPLAARFEIFINGLELGNGFRELTDAAEQLQRFERDLTTRRQTGLAEVPIDHALLDAMTMGLPECSGVAIGVERTLAVLENRNELGAMIPLAHAWQ